MLFNFLKKKQPVTTQTNTIGCKNTYSELTKAASLLNVAPYRKTKSGDPDKYADNIKADNATIKDRWIKSYDAYQYFEAVNNTTIPGTKTNNGWAFYAGNRKNVTFENCVFEAIKGVNLVGCAGVTFRNCWFKNSPGAVHLKNCSNVVIENCTIEINTTGLYTVSAIYVGGGCSNVTIRNCKVVSPACCGKAFRVGNDGMVASGVSFEDCAVEGSFSSVGFVLGKSGTATAPVRFSRISANLYNSTASVAKNLDASGKPVAIWYCNATSYGAMDSCTTHMDYDRTRSTSRMSQSNCSFDLGGRK